MKSFRNHLLSSTVILLAVRVGVAAGGGGRWDVTLG